MTNTSGILCSIGLNHQLYQLFFPTLSHIIIHHHWISLAYICEKIGINLISAHIIIILAVISASENILTQISALIIWPVLSVFPLPHVSLIFTASLSGPLSFPISFHHPSFLPLDIRTGPYYISIYTSNIV